MEDSKELAMVLANCSEAGLQAFNTWMVYKYIDIFAGVILVACFLALLFYTVKKLSDSTK